MSLEGGLPPFSFGWRTAIVPCRNGIYHGFFGLGVLLRVAGLMILCIGDP